jgi:hypothetical protein
LRFGAHQQDRGADEKQRDQNHRRADHGADGDVDPATDGPRRVEPGTGGDDDGDADQRERDAVTTMTGFEVTRATDRPRGGACAPGQHQPAGASATPDGRASGTGP